VLLPRFCAIALLFSVVAARAQTPEAVPGELLVKVRSGASAAGLSRLSATAVPPRKIAEVEGGSIHVLQVQGNVDAALNSLSKDPSIEYAEPNFLFHISAAPNDPRYGELWGLKNVGQTMGGRPGIPGADIDAQSAWDVTTGSNAVVVGVVDTGIDYNHPDLVENIWSNPGGVGGCPAGTHGYNAITKSCDPMDDHFHGTHVSGTIGAVGNNGLGVVGVNWTTSIMALKFLSASGSGSTANAIAAIDFAVQAKIAGVNVRVLSNSWGGSGFSQALLDEINMANANDILFVAAAGNSSSNNDFWSNYPSNYPTPNMVAVAATDNTDRLASFSNYGPTSVHLAAPGVDVLSTVPGSGYAYLSGTSMATPHVAGTAALLLAAQPTWTTSDVRSAILANVEPASNLNGRIVTGGRLNACRAMPGCLTIFPLAASAPPSGSLTFTASGGSGTGYTWSLAINASGGTLDGSAGAYTAGARGSVADVVQVVDSLGNSATRTVTVTRANLSIFPSPARVPPRGSQIFTAAGGSGGYTWSVTSFSGGTINASTGTYVAGAFANATDMIKVVDSVGNTAATSVTITDGVAVLPGAAIVPPSASLTFTASGGSGTGYTWSLATNASGGTMNASTGAYKAGLRGIVADVVRVVDSLGNSATSTVTVTRSDLSISPGTPRVPPRGSQIFTAAGGSGGYTWSVTSFWGGTIDASTGTYLAAAIANATDIIRVVDSAGNTVTTNVTVTDGIEILPRRIGPEDLLPPRSSKTFQAIGGSGVGYGWSLLVNGSGGTINASIGVYVAGSRGAVADVILVTDSLGNTATRTLQITSGVAVAPPFTLSLSPRGTRTFTATGGAGSPYTWSFSTNPSSGSIDRSTGTYIAGPTGGVTDTVVATDLLGNFATATVSMGAGVSIFAATDGSVPPRGQKGFNAMGGSGTGYAWALETNGSGGRIDAATGVYTAGPTGGVTDIIRVVDSLGNVATKSVGVTAGISISPARATVSPGESLNFTATGGSGMHYGWSLATNASGGTIGGINSLGAYTAGTTAGVTDIVRVVDPLGNTATVPVEVVPVKVKATSAGGCASAGSGSLAYLGLAFPLIRLKRRRAAKARGPAIG
jgi:subtilisin family serine protease